MTMVRMKFWASRVVIATSLAAGFSAPWSSAHAQTVIKGDKKKAEERQKAAFRAINSGDLDTGLVELQAAYLAYPDPKFLYNIAVAQEQKPNNCRVAHQAYEDFFAKCEGCRTEKLARSRVERLLTRCLVPMTIKSVPSGASVIIDGKKAEGVTPMVTRVWAGERKVVAELDGYQTTEAVAAVLEATPRDVIIELVKTGSLPGPTPSESLAVTTVSKQAEPSVPSWAIWTSAAAAVVAGGVGIGLGVAAQSEADSVNSNANLRPSARAQQGDDAESLATGANVAYAVAGAAAITTVVLLLWPELAGSDAPGTVGPTSSGVSIAW